MMRLKLVKLTRIRLITAFILIILMLSSIFAFFEARIYYQRRENNLYLAANQGRIIAGSIDIAMSRVYTLRSLVKTNQGDTAFFNRVINDYVMSYEETV